MNKLLRKIAIFAGFLTASSVSAAPSPFTIGSDYMVLGRGNNSVNKYFLIRQGNTYPNMPGLRYNVSSNSWEFSNDGSTWNGIGSSSAGGASNLSLLGQKLENEHFGVISDPLDNGVGSGFYLTPAAFYYRGVLIKSASSGQKSFPIVWNPIVLDNAHPDTDIFNGTATWVAFDAGASTIITDVTSGHYSTGSGGVQWTKVTGHTNSMIVYPEGSANRAVGANCDLYAWIYMTATAVSHLTNVEIGIGSSTSVYQAWTTTTTDSGGAFAAGLNVVHINICQGGTPVSTGWDSTTNFTDFIIGVNSTSGDTESYTINGIYFSQTQSIVEQVIPFGSKLTVYTGTGLERINIDSANTSISGSSVVTTSNLSNSYSQPGFVGPTIARDTLSIGSNQAAMVTTDQFGNSLSGTVSLNQEARLSKTLRSSLTSSIVDAFIGVNTSQVYPIQVAPTATTITITDPSLDILDLKLGDKLLVYQTISGAEGKKIFDKRGTMTLSVDSTKVSTTASDSSSSTPSCLTSVGSTTGIAVGNTITNVTHSSDIPSGTIVKGIGTGPCSSGQIQMSANAAGTHTGDTFNFGAIVLTCSGGGCVPSGTAIGDYVAKDHLTANFSAVTAGGNELIATTLTPMSSPEDVILYDSGIPYPNPSTVYSHWTLGTSRGNINTSSGGAPALAVNGSPTTTNTFKNGLFGTSGWSTSNFYSDSLGTSPIDGATNAKFAISLWYNSSNTTTGKMLLDKSNDTNVGYDLYTTTGGAIIFSANNATNITSSTFSTNVWHHIVIQNNNGVTNGMQLWLDGSLVGSATATISAASANGILIGKSTNGANVLSSGDVLADMITWAGSNLTQGQILQLYNNGLAAVVGFGPRLKYQYENSGVSGQLLSIEGILSRSTTSVQPFIDKMGIIVR